MSFWEREGSVARAYWEDGQAGFPVYDMHGHMGSHNKIFLPTCEAEAMVRHLRRAGVRRLVFSHHHALFTPDFSNEEAYRITARHPDVLRMYVAINPNYPERVKADVAAFSSWAPLAVGFKFLSAYHRVKVDDPRYRPALEKADELGLPILLHTWGGDGCVPIETMVSLAQTYRRARFFMGHSFRPDWEGVRTLHQACPDNVYFELTSIPGCEGMIEALVEAAGSDRLLFGTDLPWFDEFQAIGGVLAARISDDDVRNILYRNVERLLGTEW